MRRLALLALAFLACAQQPAASTSGAPVTAAPSPCRLAVIQGSPGQGAGPQTPGFLTIPGAVFSPATDAGDGMYYDKPLQKWVPAGPPALSADGLSYAYIAGDTTSSQVHLVDLRSGSDRIISFGSFGGPWRLAGVASDAVYLMRVEYVDSPAYGRLAQGKGLWKLALNGAEPAELTSDARGWVWFADGAVYGGQSTMDVAGGPNDVVRFDLRTMQVTTWFSHQVRSRLLAVDTTGAALVMGEAANEELWRAARPDDATQIWSGATDAVRPDFPVAVDGSDVWMSSSSLTPSWAIFHVPPSGALQEVARFTDRPVTVAGPCA